MKHLCSTALLLALLLLGAVFASAEPEYCYVFKLPEASFSYCLEGFDYAVVNEGRGLYKTCDAALIEILPGIAEYYEPDMPISIPEVQLPAKKTVELRQSSGAVPKGTTPSAIDAMTGELSGELWTLAMLGTNYASYRGVTGAGITVGIIDSGLTPDFSDYSDANILEGKNYRPANSTKIYDTSDNIGHGTFVASIIAGSKYGVARGVNIVPLKCFDATLGSSLSGVIEAIYDAVDVYHCDVINMSFGTDEYSQLFEEAVKYAYDAGVIMVSSSGNIKSSQPASTGNDKIYYPSAFDGVISVGAVDRKKQIARFSIQNSWVDVVAPGSSIPGLSYETKAYFTDSGTSYAAPFVTAVAALAKSVNRSLTHDAFLGLLVSTSEDLGTPGRDNTFGCGFLNAGLLLAAVRQDYDSVIYSYCNRILSVSACCADTARMYLCEFDETGRFLGTSVIYTGITNQPLTGEEPNLILFTVSGEECQPVSQYRKLN